MIKMMVFRSESTYWCQHQHDYRCRFPRNPAWDRKTQERHQRNISSESIVCSDYVSSVLVVRDARTVNAQHEALAQKG